VRDDDFEWDDRKAARNLAKHKVSFSMARDVFNDVSRIEWDDDDHSLFEQRFVAVGLVEGRLLHVTYTLRENRIRIISARVAEPWEGRRYFGDI
jgi:uncharacterized DUF497 family protein